MPTLPFEGYGLLPVTAATAPTFSHTCVAVAIMGAAAVAAVENVNTAMSEFW